VMATAQELADKVQALEKRDALLTQAIRRILEGKLEGADGAAADLVALEGGQTSINVRLGKS
jgi:hypothetical protein